MKIFPGADEETKLHGHVLQIGQSHPQIEHFMHP